MTYRSAKKKQVVGRMLEAEGQRPGPDDRNPAVK